MVTLMGPNHKLTIGRAGKALAPLGITLPEEITAPITPPRIDSPSDADITQAITAAKGDPAADKTVQRLITARALDRGGYSALLEQEAWEARWQALKSALEDLNAQVHEKFTTAAGALETVAPKLRAYTSLAQLNLATLPADTVEPARQAIEAELTLRDAHNAWQALWTSVGGQQTGGNASRILAICNPSPDEWLTHSSRRPNSLPAPGDVWATVQAGFTLDLAHDIRDAKARHDHIHRSIDRDREKRRLEYGRAKSWGLYR